MTAHPSFEEVRRRTAEAVREAEERRVVLSPELQARIAAKTAEFDSKLVRLFCGVEEQAKSKGHQPCEVLPVEVVRAFREKHPATHMWAEWEREVLARG